MHSRELEKRGKVFSCREIPVSKGLGVGQSPVLSGLIKKFSLPREKGLCEARAEGEVAYTGRHEIRKAL